MTFSLSIALCYAFIIFLGFNLRNTSEIDFEEEKNYKVKTNNSSSISILADLFPF